MRLHDETWAAPPRCVGTSSDGFHEAGVLTYPPDYRRRPHVIRWCCASTAARPKRPKRRSIRSIKWPPRTAISFSRQTIAVAATWATRSNARSSTTPASGRAATYGRDRGGGTPRHRRRIEACRFRLVVRRPADVVDDRALSDLEMRGHRRGRQRFGSRLHDRRRHRRRPGLFFAIRRLSGTAAPRGKRSRRSRALKTFIRRC